jgi:hypothetical protein
LVFLFLLIAPKSSKEEKEKQGKTRKIGFLACKSQMGNRKKQFMDGKM